MEPKQMLPSETRIKWSLEELQHLVRLGLYQTWEQNLVMFLMHLYNYLKL